MGRTEYEEHMPDGHGGPLPDAYWADPKRLLAGPHPLNHVSERAAQRARLRALLDAGIRTVIDLRTPVEPPSIRSLLDKLSEEATWVGVPILDGAAPTHPQLVTILDVIDASLARDRPVYVHCHGGLGRTGTVVACWWIRHGLFSPEDALVELGVRRRGQPHGERPSPETAPQLRLVRSWTAGA
ncbi:MAG: dual specificity protein phosphatase family protein [Sandaracinaceae bacterium]|nr:dual specificity protein phosphatase family protein [Sandaracinaceae bacterium]